MKWVVILSVAAVITLLWEWLSWRRKPSKGSFWDAVLNPGDLPDLDAMHEDADAEAEDLRGNHEMIAQLVDRYVLDCKTKEDVWFEGQVLRRLGEEAYPRALEILRDPNLQRRLHEETLGSSHEPRIEILCDLFDGETPPPAEAAPLLLPFLDCESEKVRKEVVLIIGSVGTADCLPGLETALQDDDEYVRSYALMGIERALTGGRIAETDREGYFDLVSSMWPADTAYNVSKKLPGLLVRLDEERAADFLLSDELFTTSFSSLRNILTAFILRPHLLPRERVRAIAEELIDAAESKTNSMDIGAALTMLGVYRDDRDLDLLMQHLNHPERWISRGAVQGLRTYYQFDEAERRRDEQLKQHGWDSLSEADRHILAVEYLDGEVVNGGFAQYYFNSSGNDWPVALAGLGAMGARERQAAMQSTVERFGDSGPPTDRELRMKMLSKIAKAEDDPFSEQDEAWYSLESEPIEPLLFNYRLSMVALQN